MRKLIFLFAVTLIFSSISSATADQQIAQILEDDVNIRIDSTVFSDSLGKLKKDHKLRIYAKKYNWYKVQLPSSISCFVHKDYFKKVSGKIYKANGNNINVRSAASLDSHIIGKVDRGQQVLLKGFIGDFMEIKPPRGVGGWVHQQFVSVDQTPGTDFTFNEGTTKVAETEEASQEEVTETETSTEKKDQVEKEVKPKKKEIKKEVKEKTEKKKKTTSSLTTVYHKILIGVVRKEDGRFFLVTDKGRRFRIVTKKNMEDFIDKKVEMVFRRKKKGSKSVYVIDSIKVAE